MAAVVEGTPRRVKALLRSFLRSDVSPQEEGSQRQQEESGEKMSEAMCQPRNKETFWRRMETFSQFTWFAKPVALSPLHCAQYGWENTEVDILQCVSCKACLDATLSTSWDPDMYVKTCEHLKECLISAHSKMCPWPDNPCPDSFAGLPTLTSSEWREDFCLRWRSVLELGDGIPLLDGPALRDMIGVTEEHLERLQQLAGMSSPTWRAQLPEQAEETSRAACVIALCGWQGRNDEHSNFQTLLCGLCRREVGLWNFSSMKRSSEVGAEPEEYGASPSHEETLEALTISRVLPPVRSPEHLDLESRSGETAMNIEVCEKSEVSVDSDCSTEHSSQGSYSRQEESGSDVSAMEQTKGTMSTFEENTETFSRPKASPAVQKESISITAGPFSGDRVEQRPLGAFFNRSLTDLTDIDNADSLCVEVEEESLTEKLQAVESELEYMGSSRGAPDDCEPQRKRFRPLQDMEKQPLNVLSEHRTWCPWISVSHDDDERKRDEPGWKLLLSVLLPSMSPDKAESLLESPPEEAWKNVRKLLNEWYSPAVDRCTST